jgi:predicted nucleic acid-binding protein
VKVFFDTSVLVAVFLETHEHHEPSLKAFLQAERRQGYCAAHSLAELYSVVTRMPGHHRLSGEQALLFLGDVTERLTVVALTGQEYLGAIRDAAANGIVGGAIYDALLLDCAKKSGAGLIYTWNLKHFQRFGPEVAVRIANP